MNTVQLECFVAVAECRLRAGAFRRRADVVGFVNGLPLLFVELKALGVDLREAFDKNYQDYLREVRGSPELGFQILGYVADEKNWREVPRLGGFSRLRELLEEAGYTIVDFNKFKSLL